jgi:hypothetical protein
MRGRAEAEHCVQRLCENGETKHRSMNSRAIPSSKYQESNHGQNVRPQKACLRYNLAGGAGSSSRVNVLTEWGSKRISRLRAKARRSCGVFKLNRSA